MARLTAEQKEMLIADWKTGHYSQNQLAKKYNVSPATANKMCKEVEQENAEIVNTKIAVATALQDKSEYEVNSIHQVVDAQLRRANLVYGVTEKLLQKAEMMADEITEASDLKALVDATDRASLTLKVNERHAPKIDVNQTLAQQNTHTGTEVFIVEDTKKA